MIDVSAIFQSLLAFGDWLLTEHPFAILAFLPGLIAFFNWFPAQRRLDNTISEIKDIIRKTRRKDPGFASKPEKYRTPWWHMFFGVISLTIVFGIVAALGGSGRLPSNDLGAAAAWQVTSGSPTIRRVSPSVSAAPSQRNETLERPASSEPERVINGRAGLVYAGYGAYIYTLLLVIKRLNSAALTPEFLTVSAVRSAVALVLGFTAAETNIFSGLSENQGLFILFFIGLFPSWAMDALRQKAREIFKPSGLGCDGLPLCLIDGLDDGIADHLTEIGIWDVEHVATSNPFKLAAKTIYPLSRVIDWIDQAILINYVRGQIVHFRVCGLRGAIDYACVYRDAIGGEPHNLTPVDRANLPKVRKRAEDLIKVLAQKTSYAEQALYLVGRSLFEDAVVKYIWTLWFDLAKAGNLEEGSSHKTTLWMGSSKEDLEKFSEEVRLRLGGALQDAQQGREAPYAEPLKGFAGADVLKVTGDFDGGAYGVVYTGHFSAAVYVLHAFQEKSEDGIAPQPPSDLIKKRLKRAREHYKQWSRSKNPKFL